jgi:hypothetical protein
MRVVLVVLVVCTVVGVAGFFGSRTHSGGDGFNLTGGTQTLQPLSQEDIDAIMACLRDADCRRQANECLNNPMCAASDQEQLLPYVKSCAPNGGCVGGSTQTGTITLYLRPKP